MKKEKILVVEDEADILELIEYNLTREGFRVRGVASGEDALRHLEKETFDLVVLDLMLPGKDGLEICKSIKSNPETKDLPVIMVTAKGEEADIVAGLELGADDYLPKPFSPRVLVARIRAIFRRTSTPMAEEEIPLEFGDLAILPGRHEVRVKGEPVTLTLTEFRIIHFLSRRPGWVFTRYQIIDGVQGEDHVVTDRSVDVQIVGLRKKLGPEGKRIETVRGVGYRFKE
ncbi:MAG: response regulator transcription factor [Planctomycetes bacterium]|nr:response regulator transcription factor [Planctomycetota bacterium]